MKTFAKLSLVCLLLAGTVPLIYGSCSVAYQDITAYRTIGGTARYYNYSHCINTYGTGNSPNAVDQNYVSTVDVYEWVDSPCNPTTAQQASTVGGSVLVTYDYDVFYCEADDD